MGDTGHSYTRPGLLSQEDSVKRDSSAPGEPSDREAPRHPYWGLSDQNDRHDGGKEVERFFHKDYHTERESKERQTGFEPARYPEWQSGLLPNGALAHSLEATR